MRKWGVLLAIHIRAWPAAIAMQLYVPVSILVRTLDKPLNAEPWRQQQPISSSRNRTPVQLAAQLRIR